jgi:hypothetical protein
MFHLGGEQKARWRQQFDKHMIIIIINLPNKNRISLFVISSGEIKVADGPDT